MRRYAPVRFWTLPQTPDLTTSPSWCGSLCPAHISSPANLYALASSAQKDCNAAAHAPEAVHILYGSGMEVVMFNCPSCALK